MHPRTNPGNRLIDETSPYLLQHAHDPVDWFAWGPEAQRVARELDRPMFLSIGYAACHWCHVMHRESFSDPETARDLNEGFVSVKVDREERPDVDALYMDALQAMTGGGGWPMSVFLTPDGRPFHAGTYYPDTPRHGAPAFRQVLSAVSDAWRERRDEVEAGATRLAEAVARGQRSVPVSAGVTADTGVDATSALDRATATLVERFDTRIGAWGGAPLFPQPMVIEHLLRETLRTGNDRALATARRALDAMAAGGIRDHLAGGFARYATDARWLVPHFEKMLYDNAQLARAYLHAWQATGESAYRDVVAETLDFLERDLLVTHEGSVVGFATSLDADTDGVEGATYVWTQPEVRAILGDAAELFEAAYGVTANGNWEGATILSRVRDDAALARDTGLDAAEVARRLAAARGSLVEARAARPQPARDDKVLASWNGLALRALAEAGASMPEGDRYLALATSVATSIRERLRPADGRLRRSWKDGRPGPAAVLEDHTHLAAGLLALYQATFDERWFTWAVELLGFVREHYADPRGGFLDTADDATDLFARPRSLVDGAIPSGNAMAATVMAVVHAYTGDAAWAHAAGPLLDAVAPLAAEHPTAFPQWLIAVSHWRVPIDEVAIVGAADDPRALVLLDVARQGLRPWQVVALSAQPDTSAIPLLHARGGHHQPTAWVCHGGACRMPVSDPDALRAELRAGGA
jgi:uncharacterized protein YyaL (SSP411 family)